MASLLEGLTNKIKADEEKEQELYDSYKSPERSLVLNLSLENGAKECSKTVQRSVLVFFRSRRELSNEHLLANLASIQPRTSPNKFASSSSREFELKP